MDRPPLGTVKIALDIEGDHEKVLVFLTRGMDDSLLSSATVGFAITPNPRRSDYTRLYYLPAIKTSDVAEQAAQVRRQANIMGEGHVECVLDIVGRLAKRFQAKPRGR